MKVVRSILLGALIGFSATMLHNIFQLFGFIASLVITFLGMRIINQTFFYVRYQLFAAATYLAVIIKAGNLGTGDELLIYSNTYGNLFLIAGFTTLIISIIKPNRSKN
ncbi:MAG: hypothetical protein RL455_801 [Actinomycetota bacterium]